MSQKLVGIQMRILCSDGIERSDLLLMFDGQRPFFCDQEGTEYEMDRFLGGAFHVPPLQAGIIMKKFKG